MKSITRAKGIRKRACHAALNWIAYDSYFTHIVDCAVAIVLFDILESVFSPVLTGNFTFHPCRPPFLILSSSPFLTTRFVSIAGIPFLYLPLLSSREFSSCAFLLSFNPFFRGPTLFFPELQFLLRRFLPIVSYYS